MKEKIIHPPTVFVVSILSEVFLHFLFPVFKVIPFELRNLGWVVIVLSVFLALWQFFTMNGKTKIPYGSMPAVLLTSGPFKYTRNAFYLSIILISLGVAVYLRELLPFMVVAVEFFVFDKYLIPPEEKVLEEKFGQEYKDYRKKVRRWI